jgi:hypothetical protein
MIGIQSKRGGVVGTVAQRHLPFCSLFAAEERSQLANQPVFLIPRDNGPQRLDQYIEPVLQKEYYHQIAGLYDISPCIEAYDWSCDQAYGPGVLLQAMHVLK